MDFQTLSRRELQALCKSNKIPANMTNVAMADALAALSHVEGIEELGKDLCETPLRQTASRTTTRRKPAIEREPEASIQSTRTRRAKSNAVSEKTDEEEENTNTNINSLLTPAAPTTRRRVPLPSARTKLATEKKAPAAATGQSVYSTRRSTRLLEKTMAELTLTDTKTVKPNAVDEEAPKEVNMTEQDTIKPIKMEELHAEEDTPKGICNEDEGNKDIEDEKSSVIPETEIKREVVDVPDLEEETKEETLDNGAEENKDDTAATNVGNVIGNDVLITNVESAKRDLGSVEKLVEADDSSKPSHDKLVEEGIEMKDQEVKTEEGMNREVEEVEKNLPDVEEVEEAADVEVMDDQAIFVPEYINAVAVENANEEVESKEGEKSLPDVEEVEEAADVEVMDDQAIFVPEYINAVAVENANEEVESKEGEKSLPDVEEVEESADLEVMDNFVAAENGNEEDEAIQLPIGSTAATSLVASSVKKMKEKESGKEEEPLLQVYADPESVPANNNTTPAGLKSSSKMNQSALVDVNKENNSIHESGRKVVEPLGAVNANAVDVVIQKETAAKRLEEKSIRELRKLLKEKLVISNKEGGDEAPAAATNKKQQQQQVRQALQKLPENLQTVGEAE